MLNMFVASLESTFNSSYWSGYSGYSIPPMVDPYYDYPPSYYYPQVDTIYRYLDIYLHCHRTPSWRPGTQ